MTPSTAHCFQVEEQLLGLTRQESFTPIQPPPPLGTSMDHIDPKRKCPEGVEAEKISEAEMVSG